MLVIGERKIRFRVNVGPTDRPSSPKNYGPVDDLSAITGRGIEPTGAVTARFRTMNSGHQHPAGAWLTGHSALAVPPPL